MYLEDNWQHNNRMTFNLGLRYEVPFPYVEANGHMANLDVTPDFTAAAVVLPGQTGPVTNFTYPSALVRTDWNNIGPRVGMAYRLARGTVLNTSYSITYNTTSYSSIAQRVVAQPPFSDTLTNAGSIADPLSLETALLEGTGVTNNFGIDPLYGLGKMAVYLGLVEDDGYDGRGSTPTTSSSPSRSPSGTGGAHAARAAPERAAATGRTGTSRTAARAA